MQAITHAVTQLQTGTDTMVEPQFARIVDSILGNCDSAPAAPQFACTPCQHAPDNIINYGTSIGNKIYKAATSPLSIVFNSPLPPLPLEHHPTSPHSQKFSIRNYEKLVMIV